MENIYEQYVYSKSDGRAQIKFFSTAILSVLLFLVAFASMILAVTQSMWVLLGSMVVSGAAAIFLWRKKDEAYVEYEYSYVVGDLEVAKIINNKRRKMLCKFPCRDIEAFGKITSSAYQRYLANPNVKKVYATFMKETENEVYYMYYVGKKAKYLIHFEPDAELLAFIKKHLRVIIDVK